MQRLATGAAPARVPPSVPHALQSAGRPLEPQSRAAMEASFGHDFARVRVHTDSSASASARAVRAAAFTVGDDIVFDAGAYSPDSSSGRRLLAHELTHVVQQRNAGVPASYQASRGLTLTMSRPGDRAEREAERVATDVLAGREARVAERPRATMHGGWRGVATGAAAGAGAGALIGSFFGPLGALIGAGVGALAGGVIGYFATRAPLFDMSTFQSPGASGWWGAKYGCYRDGCTRPHRGWDIHAPSGTDTYAVTSGTAVHGEDADGWGHYIRLTSDSDPNRTYIYAHLSNREPAGAYTFGSKLGQTGTSGNARHHPDRPHLHFEIRNGATAIDPSSEYSEPSRVIEATGSTPTTIDKSAAPPCVPCAV